MKIRIKSTHDYAAEMTFNQFDAISRYMTYFDLVTELKAGNLNYNQRDADVRFDNCCKILHNAWSTENNLINSLKLVENESCGFMLQWIFPMAYYSVFTLASLFYYLNNYLDDFRVSHSKVQKKFSELVKTGKYPQSISYYADGGKNKIEVCNLEYHPMRESIKYNANEREDVERQIGQFLKTTRTIRLDEYHQQNSINFRTKSGLVKKRLNKEDWQNISYKIGATSLINLLYRKRIKGNYREIDTFLIDTIKTKEIIESLLKIVNHLNTIHEYHIMKLVGKDRFLKVIDGFDKNRDSNFVFKRIKDYM